MCWGGTDSVCGRRGLLRLRRGGNACKAHDHPPHTPRQSTKSVAKTKRPRFIIEASTVATGAGMASRGSGAATTVSPAASAAEVARVLVAARCKAAGVTDTEGKLVGLVSVRDIIKRVVYPGKSVNDVVCKDFMTPSPASVSEAEAADVEKVLTIMAQRGFRHMPVVKSTETMEFTRMLDVLSVTQQVLSPKSGSVVQVRGRPLRRRQLSSSVLPCRT